MGQHVIQGEAPLTCRNQGIRVFLLPCNCNSPFWKMVPQSVITQVSDSSGVNAISNVSSGHGFYDWLFECHGFWHNATLNIPSFLFVFYLALQARHSLLKLSLARSYIIISYNLCLWLITLLNLAWCFLQVRFRSCIITRFSSLPLK